jgi:hypothetical protein
MRQIKSLMWAQLEYTRDLLTAVIESGAYGDDTHDDVTGALSLSERMMWIAIDGDEVGLRELLDEGLAGYACGGISEAFYALKPKALAYLEDAS